MTCDLIFFHRILVVIINLGPTLSTIAVLYVVEMGQLVMKSKDIKKLGLRKVSRKKWIFLIQMDKYRDL